MNYKALALDIDGTIRNSKKEIMPKTKAAIQKCADDGVLIMIASGRCPYGIYPTAEELGLDTRGGYILGYNGAKVINCKTGEVIVDMTFPKGTASKLFAFAKEHGVDMFFYGQKDLITNNPENKYVIYEARINGLGIKKTEDFREYDDLSINDFTFTEDPEQILKTLPFAEEAFGNDMSVFRGEPFFIIMVPKGVDKGNALKQLLEHYKIDRTQAAACGDGYNDVSMIEYAGLGVAMGNAQPGVKKCADYITSSCDEDGVAEVIEKFFK